MVHVVPVAGGELTVEVSAGDTAPVLAIHGISSHRRLFDWLHAVAPEITLVVPDLRGRGDSIDVAGPSNMKQHAADMLAVIDALGYESVDLCGMSMGGFIAVALATQHPERVRSVTLVDGGFPMPQPPGLTEELVGLAFQDRLARLEQAWPSVEEYAAFFCANTAPLLDPTDPMVLAYLRHDLTADGRVRLSGDALVQDATDVFFGDELWRNVRVPTRLVYAEWSTGRDTPPAYTPTAVAGFATELSSLVDAVRVDGVDHATSIMSERSSRAVADMLRAATGQ